MLRSAKQLPISKTMKLASKCPFVNGLSTSFLRKAGPSLLSFADRCPVMSQVVASRTSSTATPVADLPDRIPLKIPSSSFVSSEIIKEPVPQSTPFQYEDFFEAQIAKKKADHSYRVFRKVNRLAEDFPKAQDFSHSNDPSKVTVWCSNDYLGMSRHPKVVQTAHEVIRKHGVGAGGTRNISGTSSYHNLLEKELASWHKKERALLFTSCYVANDTTLFTLGKQLKDCVILSDEGNHASMIHGIRTSQAKKLIFKHNDPHHLEELLKSLPADVPKIVAFESVHSMTGAICPLEELCDISHRYGALTFVDEVHAVGLYGVSGAGIGDRDNVLDKIDIISGTLGKAIGVVGGYIAASDALIDNIRSYGSGFIFTTALPPDKAAAAVASIEILKSQEGLMLRQTHQSHVRKLRNKLLQKGFPVEYAPSHIIPVLVGDPDLCTKVSEDLQLKYNIYVQAINFPTVPRGEEKLRIAPTPLHTAEMFDDLVVALEEIWKENNLPFVRPVCLVDCSCQKKCASLEYPYPLQLARQVNVSA